MSDIKNYNEAQSALITLDAKNAAGMVANAAYLNGDHWQGSTAWGGPPIPLDMSGAAETMRDTERGLVPIPVIAEVMDAYTTGVVGNDPAFQVELKRELADGEVATPEEIADIGKLNDALTAFFDTAGAMEPIQDFVTNLLSGRGCLRFYMPPVVAERANARPFSDVIEAAANFYLEAPPWSSIGVLLDRASMRRTAVFIYAPEESGAQPSTSNRAEITTVQDDGSTLFRVFDDNRVTHASAFDCNGQVWVFQSTLSRPIIGDPQRRLQRIIDFLNYILPKNAQYAGFRERHMIAIEQEKDDETGLSVDPELGPGSLSFWKPTTYLDSKGDERPGAAHLVIAEPVNSSPIRGDIDHNVRCLLKSVHQLHTVISGDATASAVSRVQSRAQFTRALLRLKPKVEKPLRDLFETVLCLACHVSGNTGLLNRYKANYRIRVDVRPDAGPLTPEEIKTIVELWKSGLLDMETAQTMIGLEDIGSIANRLASEAESNVDLQVKRAQLFNEWSQTFDADTAAELAGLSEKQLKVIQKAAGGESSGSDTDNAGDDSAAA